jgi:hypothetical protein
MFHEYGRHQHCCPWEMQFNKAHDEIKGIALGLV